MGLKGTKFCKCECFFFVCSGSLEAAEHIQGIMEIMTSTSEENNTCTSLIGSAGIFRSLWRENSSLHVFSNQQHFRITLPAITFDSRAWKRNVCEITQERRLVLAGRSFKNTAEEKQDNLTSGNTLWAVIKKEKVGSYYSLKSQQHQETRIRMLVLVERADRVYKSFITHPTMNASGLLLTWPPTSTLKYGSVEGLLLTEDVIFVHDDGDHCNNLVAQAYLRQVLSEGKKQPLSSQDELKKQRGNEMIKCWTGWLDKHNNWARSWPKSWIDFNSLEQETLQLIKL